MGLGPWRPDRDIERALERGELKMAVAAAKDVAREYGHPIPVDLAVRFLPIVVAQRPEAFDRWALRWLARWTDTSKATIERAAEIAAALADLPSEPVTAWETITRLSRR